MRRCPTMALCRQDDEFFVDQVRTSVDVLKAQGRDGVFWLGYAPDSHDLITACYVSISEGDGRSCGPLSSCADVVVVEPVAGRVGKIGAITVSPEYKRCGVGQQVLQYAEAEAAYHGCDTLQVR